MAGAPRVDERISSRHPEWRRQNLGARQLALDTREARCLPCEVAQEERAAHPRCAGRHPAAGSAVRTGPSRIAGPLLLSLALLGGCSEIVSIRSGPSGASVYMDDKPIGTTPVDHALSRSELDEPHRVRIEKAGYQTVQTELRTRLAKGRVTGAVFTLGLV